MSDCRARRYPVMLSQMIQETLQQEVEDLLLLQRLAQRANATLELEALLGHTAQDVAVWLLPFGCAAEGRVDGRLRHHTGLDGHDYLQLPDGRIAVVLGDVAGKEVPPC